MRKVSRNHNWTECKPNDNCSPDGQNCVWLTDSENVVSWTDDYSKPCSDGSYINGTDCFVKDNSQEIVWTRLPPGKMPKDYRFDHGTGVCDLINRPFELKWEQSAVIVMDMWDRHPYQGTGARAAELAPQINTFLTFARSQGAQIVHSPSCDWPAGILDQGLSAPCEFVGRYDQHPARAKAINARRTIFPNAGNHVTRQFYYYLSNGDAITNTSAYNSILDNLDACPSSNTDPRFGGNPQGQTDLIDIVDTGPAGGDVISADGLGRAGDNSAYEELLALTIDRPYLIYCGINTNMCILKRTNGMRTMYQAGKALWLVRDLTDAMVGPTTTGLTDWCRQIDHRVSGTSRSPMHFDHYTGTQMVVDWIGDTLNACTDTSDKAGAGLQRFWFRDDPNRPGSPPKYYILNKKYPGLTIPARGDGLGHWDHVDADASAYGAAVCQWTLNKIVDAGAGLAYFEVLNVARPDTGIAGPDNVHTDGGGSINTQQPQGRANARWLIPADPNGNPRTQTYFRMYNQKFTTYAMVAPRDGGGPWVYFQEPNTGEDHELWQLTPV